MNVSYVEPLRLAWSRMARMLFRPARAGLWFTLGFAAFLSEYLSWGIGGSRFGGRVRPDFSPDVLPADMFGQIVDFMRSPVVTGLVIWFAACALIAYVLLAWISSRGRFIFLDNVARERTAIVEPWRRFGRIGNSLFVWRMVFNAILLMVVGAIATPFLAVIAALLHADSFRPADLLVLLPLPFMLLPVGIVAGYVHLYRVSFIEPIMYRDDCGVLAAWKRFLALFTSRPLPFLVYGLYALALLIVAFALVLGFGLGTLMIGFFLLATPYIGSVVMLPLEVTARALGPEFLAQFGSDYVALGVPKAPLTPPAAPATSAPTPG